MQRDSNRAAGFHDSRKGSIAVAAKILTALIAMILVGCQGRNREQKDDSAAGANQNFIAVIDLNVVAKEIGALEKINEALSQEKNLLEAQLDELKVKLEQRYAESKAELGENLNERQQSELEQMLQQNEKSLLLQAQAADEQLSSHHNKLKLNLLDQVRPVAFAVAQDQGMSIVLTTSQVYAAGPSVNITHQVIQRINAKNAESAQAAAEGGAAAHTAKLPLPPAGGGDFLPQCPGCGRVTDCGGVSPLTPDDRGLLSSDLPTKRRFSKLVRVARTGSGRGAVFPSDS